MPCGILSSRFLEAFHPDYLFGFYLLSLAFGVEANVSKVESDGSEMSAKFQSLSLAEPNLTGFLGQEVGEFGASNFLLSLLSKL